MALVLAAPASAPGATATAERRAGSDAEDAEDEDAEDEDDEEDTLESFDVHRELEAGVERVAQAELWIEKQGKVWNRINAQVVGMPTGAMDDDDRPPRSATGEPMSRARGGSSDAEFFGRTLHQSMARSMSSLTNFSQRKRTVLEQQVEREAELVRVLEEGSTRADARMKQRFVDSERKGYAAMQRRSEQQKVRREMQREQERVWENFYVKQQDIYKDEKAKARLPLLAASSGQGAKAIAVPAGVAGEAVYKATVKSHEVYDERIESWRQFVSENERRTQAYWHKKIGPDHAAFRRTLQHGALTGASAFSSTLTPSEAQSPPALEALDRDALDAASPAASPGGSPSPLGAACCAASCAASGPAEARASPKGFMLKSVLARSRKGLAASCPSLSLDAFSSRSFGSGGSGNDHDGLRVTLSAKWSERAERCGLSLKGQALERDEAWDRAERHLNGARERYAQINENIRSTQAEKGKVWSEKNVDAVLRKKKLELANEKQLGNKMEGFQQRQAETIRQRLEEGAAKGRHRDDLLRNGLAKVRQHNNDMAKELVDFVNERDAQHLTNMETRRREIEEKEGHDHIEAALAKLARKKDLDAQFRTKAKAEISAKEARFTAKAERDHVTVLQRARRRHNTKINSASPSSVVEGSYTDGSFDDDGEGNFDDGSTAVESPAGAAAGRSIEPPTVTTPTVTTWAQVLSRAEVLSLSSRSTSEDSPRSSSRPKAELLLALRAAEGKAEAAAEAVDAAAHQASAAGEDGDDHEAEFIRGLEARSAKWLTDMRQKMNQLG